VKILIGFAGLLAGIFFYARWEYRECKKVGHGTFYCLTHDGGR